MNKPNEILAPAEIHYKDIMDLGFSREESHDEVWEKQNGYPYFFCLLNLAKRISIEWSPESKNARVLRVDKNESIVGQITITSLQQLKEIVFFFKNEKPLRELREHEGESNISIMTRFA